MGGTTEARQLAGVLAERRDLSVTLSLAGRTREPVDQGVPVQVGGFGGAEGLARYLRENGFALLIDATHPFAARISANAVEAAGIAGVPLIALRRLGWEQVAGDRWISVDSVEAGVAALGPEPRNAFLAVGRQELAPFEAAPQHLYLIRSVDPVEPPLNLPNARYMLARGPFDEAAERDLLEREEIDIIVCKNSGGEATYGKIAAARTLGKPVVMIERPSLPDVQAGGSVGEVAMLALHALGLA